MCNVCNILLLRNGHDRFTVTAYETAEEEVYSRPHTQRNIHLSALFLDHSGSIEESITDVRRHSREAGGMEIFC